MATTFAAEQLHQLQLRDRLTDAQAAARINRSVHTWRKYRTGRVVPTVAVLGLIADAFAVPVDDLYDKDDPADAVTRFTAELRALVDAAPPLTEAQRAALAGLLTEVA